MFSYAPISGKENCGLDIPSKSEFMPLITAPYPIAGEEPFK